MNLADIHPTLLDLGFRLAMNPGWVWYDRMVYLRLREGALVRGTSHPMGPLTAVDLTDEVTVGILHNLIARHIVGDFEATYQVALPCGRVIEIPKEDKGADYARIWLGIHSSYYAEGATRLP